MTCENDQVIYKGELLPKVYQSEKGSFYAVYARRRALHGKWYVFAGGATVLACCDTAAERSAFVTSLTL